MKNKEKYMKPRESDLTGKVFSDDDGNKYQGLRVIQVPTDDEESIFGVIETYVEYNEGKFHGKPAIKYPDGLEEEWDNGIFVKVLELPYKERD